MLGDNMKRISIIAILMLALAACGSPSSVSPSASPTVSPSASPTVSPTVSPSLSPTVSPNLSTRGGAYSSVYGQIVRRDTGEPYPNAYVRFGWLVNATYEQETHTVTDDSGRYEIQLPAGQYQVTAGDSCDLNAGFAVVGRAPDDVTITVPGTSEVDFVEYPITPGADLPGVC
jgi:hypothetical protein